MFQITVIITTRSARVLTTIHGVEPTAERELICQDNSGIDSQDTASEPPSDGITKEVDLLASIVLRPEAHATQ